VPVIIPSAIRNPLDERALVRVVVKGVPSGWRVHFPHSWVWLEGKAEKKFNLTVVPMFDWNDLAGIQNATHHIERKLYQTARVVLEGSVPRVYDTPVEPFHEPAGSRYYPIGGIQGNVSVKKKVRVWLEEKDKRDECHQDGRKTTIAVRGAISMHFDKQRVRVVCTDPKGRDRIVQAFTNAEGEFEASFDLNMAPSLESSRRLWKEAREIVPGTYRVQAMVTAASMAAEAESNEVFVQR
jgi:hypothetical protein